MFKLTGQMYHTHTNILAEDVAPDFAKLYVHDLALDNSYSPQQGYRGKLSIYYFIILINIVFRLFQNFFTDCNIYGLFKTDLMADVMYEERCKMLRINMMYQEMDMGKIEKKMLNLIEDNLQDIKTFTFNAMGVQVTFL